MIFAQNQFQKKGVDITLKDRKNEFINENKTLCEENCELINYNYGEEIVKCSCPVKINIPLIEEIKFDKNELLKRFKDINYISNLNAMKCYKIVFDIKNIKNNYGFFILFFIIMLYFICLIIFVIHSFYNLKTVIKNIVFSIKTTRKKKSFRQLNLRQNLLQLDIIKPAPLNTLYIKYAQNLYDFNKIKTDKEKTNTMILDTGDDNINSEKNLEYKDFELNCLDYEFALKYDKRTYIQYYFGLLKTNHLFIFSFITFNDYNSRIIKMFLFFYFFAIDLTVNALFFNDETMHKIYIDEGKYNFIYQIPQIVYSSLISNIFDFLTKFLALSQDSIVKLKQERKMKDLDKKYKKLLKNLKIKFLLFFTLTFIFLFFFWYYISCFCGVYTNTQIHLIKDSVISFLTSLIAPFGIYLIPGLFRIPSLSNPKKKRECLYNFSKIL